jgi:RNA-binding protein 39
MIIYFLILLQIEQVQLLRDDNGVSRGYAFVTVRCICCVFYKIHSHLQFRLMDDGRRALEQLNGFELAGRPIKVGMVNDAASAQQQQSGNTQVRSLEAEEMGDRAGVDLGTTGRLALMAKLAEGLFLVVVVIVYLFMQVRDCRYRHRRNRY